MLGLSLRPRSRVFGPVYLLVRVVGSLGVGTLGGEERDFIHSWAWLGGGPWVAGGVLGVSLSRFSRFRPGLSVGLCDWEWGRGGRERPLGQGKAFLKYPTRQKTLHQAGYKCSRYQLALPCLDLTCPCVAALLLVIG